MTDPPLHPAPRPPPPDLPHARGGLVPDPESPPVSALGVKPAFHYRTTVPQTLTPNDYPRLTSLVRALAPGTGSVREFGDGLLWEQESRFSALSVTINPEPAGAVIRADLRLDGRQGAYYLGALVAAVATTLTATTVLPGVSSLSLGAGSLLPYGVIARALWNHSARRSMRQVRALVTQLAAALRGELE
jgi:hypothetical protein